MSLINKVLRDLDRRKSAKSTDVDALEAVKAARVSSPASPMKRMLRWGAGGLLTVVAVVAGGVAQGSISWPGRDDAKPAAAASVIRSAAPVAPNAVAASAAPAQTAVVLKLEPSLKISAQATPADAAPGKPAHAAKPASSLATDIAASKPEARIAKTSSAATPQERADAHYQRGIVAYQSGRIDESAEAFTAALREDKVFAPARQALAGVLLGQSRTEEAIALLRDGLAATPRQPGLSLMLARLQADRLDIDGALATLKAAATQAGSNADYLGFHAAILQRAERHAEAVEHFTAALRLLPGHSVWWMGLGISLSAVNQNAQAREAFMRAKMIGALPPEAVQYVDGRLRQLM